jgi:hypothetical protein
MKKFKEKEEKKKIMKHLSRNTMVGKKHASKEQ